MCPNDCTTFLLFLNGFKNLKFTKMAIQSTLSLEMCLLECENASSYVIYIVDQTLNFVFTASTIC